MALVRRRGGGALRAAEDAPDAGKVRFISVTGHAPDQESRRKVFAARAPEMCSRLFHAGMRYEVAGGRLRPQPAPGVKLKDRFVEAAILGGAAHLRENDAAPEDFLRNFGRDYEAMVLENELLRAVVVPELGGRIYSLRWKAAGLELMRVIDPIRFVNYPPYRAGYEFSIDPATGMGATEAFEVLEQQAGSRVVLGVEFDGGVRLRSEFMLDGGVLSLDHIVENGAEEPVTVRPCTHPEWNYDLFGPQAEVRFRNADGSWRVVPINPEGRQGRDLPFTGTELPAGRWRLSSPACSIEIEETFPADAVERVRIAFYERNACLDLDLCFGPQSIAPGQSATFSVSWRFSQQGESP